MRYPQVPGHSGYPAHAPGKRGGGSPWRSCLLAAVVAGVLVVGSCTIIAVTASKSGPLVPTPIMTTSSNAPSTRSTSASAAPASVNVKPKVILAEHGQGNKSTATFLVHGDWDLHYSYDCSQVPGGQGTFIVGTTEDPGFINEMGPGGQDTTHQHGVPSVIEGRDSG